MDEVISLRLQGLTDTQQRLLRLAASGATMAEQAAHLGLSPRAVRRELDGVVGALGVRDVGQAALLWWGSRAGARADLRAAVEQFQMVAPSTGSAAA